jgi:hypothetical protein
MIGAAEHRQSPFQYPGEAIGQRPPVCGGDQHGAPAGCAPVALDVTRHHHRAGRHGLEQDHPERFTAERRGTQHIGRQQPTDFLRFREDAEPFDVLRGRVQPAQGRGQRTVPGDPEHRALGGLPVMWTAADVLEGIEEGP